MPKRVIDGEALWKSRKLKSVKAEYRSHYANWLPMANHKGVFEAGTDTIWSTVYSFLMPEVGEAEVADILKEFVGAGLLQVWDEDGRKWGYFVGIDKPGRLPPKGHVSRYADNSPNPPGTNPGGIPEASGCVPQGFGVGVGSGSGIGLGVGLGIGTGADDEDLDVKVFAIAKLYRKIADPLHLTNPIQIAITHAILRHGYETVLNGVAGHYKYSQHYTPHQRNFIPDTIKFFDESQYLNEPEYWDRSENVQPIHRTAQTERISHNDASFLAAAERMFGPRAQANGSELQQDDGRANERGMDEGVLPRNGGGNPVVLPPVAPRKPVHADNSRHPKVGH